MTISRYRVAGEMVRIPNFPNRQPGGYAWPGLATKPMSSFEEFWKGRMKELGDGLIDFFTLLLEFSDGEEGHEEGQ